MGGTERRLKLPKLRVVQTVFQRFFRSPIVRMTRLYAGMLGVAVCCYLLGVAFAGFGHVTGASRTNVLPPASTPTATRSSQSPAEMQGQAAVSDTATATPTTTPP